ncbi:unnamed protein product, partial [Ectocarpus sp. 12 AP-2014]
MAGEKNMIHPQKPPTSKYPCRNSSQVYRRDMGHSNISYERDFDASSPLRKLPSRALRTAALPGVRPGDRPSLMGKKPAEVHAQDTPKRYEHARHNKPHARVHAEVVFRPAPAIIDRSFEVPGVPVDGAAVLVGPPRVVLGRRLHRRPSLARSGGGVKAPRHTSKWPRCLHHRRHHRRCKARSNPASPAER